MSQVPANARPLLIALVAVAVGLPAAMAISGCPQDTVAGDDLDAQIRGLLEERLKLVERVAKEVESQHESGVVPMGHVLAAREARWRAKLDLSTTAAERVEVHEKLAALAQEAEKALASRAAAGTAGTTDALRAKVRRIEAEVALLRARQE